MSFAQYLPPLTIDSLLDSVLEDVLLFCVHGKTSVEGETGCFWSAGGTTLEFHGGVVSIVKVYDDVASLSKLQGIGWTESVKERLGERRCVSR